MKLLSNANENNEIVGAILDQYYRLPKNGKPKLSNEYTVFASCYAVVEHLGRHYVHILSMATGTKCMGLGDCIEDIDESRVKDCHAEVVSKRGLQRFLMKSMHSYLELLLHDLEQESEIAIPRASHKLAQSLEFPFDVELKSCGVSTDCTGNLEPQQEFLFRRQPVEELVSLTQFRMKPSWRIGLFVSDPLCGDASIYPKCLPTLTGNSGVAFTGAKPVVDTGNGTSAREDEQTVGVARTKSGRSDLPTQKRTSSMSCSDKACRWAAVGVQGAALALLLTAPVHLSAIVVAADEQAPPGGQQAALERCVWSRLEKLGLKSCAGGAPDLRVYSADADTGTGAVALPLVFAEGKCRVEGGWRSTPVRCGMAPKACPLSLNWVANAPGMSLKEEAGGRATTIVSTTAADPVEQWHLSRQKRTLGRTASVDYIRDRPPAATERLTGSREGTTEVLLGQAGIPQGAPAKPRARARSGEQGNDRSHERLAGKRKADQLNGTPPVSSAVATGVEPDGDERVICSRLATRSFALLLAQLLEVLSRIHRLQMRNSGAESAIIVDSDPPLSEQACLNLYRECKARSHVYQRSLDLFLSGDQSPFRHWRRGCGRTGACTARFDNFSVSSTHS